MVERPRRRQGDAGFTLVEMLVAVAVLGIVSGALAAALMLVVKTQSSATDRYRDSHSAQLLTTYLPADVQSVAPNNQADTTFSAGWQCAGAAPGSNLLRLAAGDSAGTTTYISYRYQQVGAEYQVVRYTCRLGTAPTSIVAAHTIAAPPAGWAPGQDPKVVTTAVAGAQITMTAKEVSGYTFTVTGARVNTAATVPSPTTAVNPTIPPSMACTASAPSFSPNPSTRIGTNLSAPITVTVGMSGVCSSSLSISYIPSGTTVVTQALTASGSTWTGTIPAIGAVWSVGTKVATFVQGNGQTPMNGTANFSVQDPCSVSSLAASPSSVAQGAGGKGLASAVTVTGTFDAACAVPPNLTFTPTTGPVTIPMVATGATWTATIPASGYDFAAGAQTVSVAPAGGGPILGTTSGTFPVTAWVSPCTFQATQAASPSSNPRDANGGLNQDERIVLQPAQNAVCTNIAIEYRIGDGTTVRRATVAEGSNITGIIPAHTEVFGRKQNVSVAVIDVTNGGRTQLWSTTFQAV
jgi:prepilin-type N-terminal cleavage/methylation domain-containing protein